MAKLDEKKLKKMEEELKVKLADLEKLDTELKKRAAEMDKREKDLESREKAVAKKETALKDGADPSDERELTKSQLKLISEAVDAYGIGDEYVFNAGIDQATGKAVVITKGGAKVKYASGDEVEPLSPIQITGVNPEAKKRKPIAGKPKDKK